jgi:hypothetical protein
VRIGRILPELCARALQRNQWGTAQKSRGKKNFKENIRLNWRQLQKK